MAQGKLSKANMLADGEPHSQRHSLSRRRVERVIARVFAKQGLQPRGFLGHADFEGESNERFGFHRPGSTGVDFRRATMATPEPITETQEEHRS